MAKDNSWEFPILLYRYLENEELFSAEWQYDFNDIPWEVRAELKGFEAVLNAFTGGKYNIKTQKGRKEIRFAFMYGFNRTKDMCTDVQLKLLRDLFPYKSELYDKWENEKPLIGDLYEVMFGMVYCGFKYFTLFNDYPQGSVSLKIVEMFKSNEIDQHVDDMLDVFIKAIFILLGPDYERSISRSELIKKYGYPNVLN